MQEGSGEADDHHRLRHAHVDVLPVDGHVCSTMKSDAYCKQENIPHSSGGSSGVRDEQPLRESRIGSSRLATTPGSSELCAEVAYPKRCSNEHRPY